MIIAININPLLIIIIAININPLLIIIAININPPSADSTYCYCSGSDRDGEGRLMEIYGEGRRGSAPTARRGTEGGQH